MPEVGIRKTEGTIKASKRSSNDFVEKKVLAEEGKEWVGGGRESLVFVDPRNPKKVIAVSREDMLLTPQAAKKLFYAHNIFNTLFPHNFPHFYAAFSTNQEVKSNHSGTVRERIIPKKVKPLIKRFQIKYPFSRVKKICEEWDIPLFLDDNKFNFTVGSDGGEYYTDLLMSINAKSMDTILPYMETHHYSDKDKDKVRKNIQRLTEI